MALSLRWPRMLRPSLNDATDARNRMVGGVQGMHAVQSVKTRRGEVGV
jgi:hypothetical protein